MRTVAVLALDDVIPFDLATAVEVFGWAETLEGTAAYDVVVAGPQHEIVAGPIGMIVPHDLEQLDRADLVIVPGRRNPSQPAHEGALDAVRRAHERGATVASICVGAFDLAAAGILTARKATTHWAAAAELAALYPEIRVDPRALYVDEGSILTSAGAAAGLDLCLYLVERDYGSKVAADAARRAVVPLRREGSQAQYVEQNASTPANASLTPILEWIEMHANEQITVPRIAAVAHLSVRTLSRRFAAEIGVPPGKYLARVRARKALALLETTRASVASVAAATGFGTAANLRARLRDSFDTAPTRYRSTFASERKV
jgi:transcriptional regulator GlxA family with amidase domain